MPVMADVNDHCVNGYCTCSHTHDNEAEFFCVQKPEWTPGAYTYTQQVIIWSCIRPHTDLCTIQQSDIPQHFPLPIYIGKGEFQSDMGFKIISRAHFGTSSISQGECAWSVTSDRLWFNSIMSVLIESPFMVNIVIHHDAIHLLLQ